jgi:hypothetical protein
MRIKKALFPESISEGSRDCVECQMMGIEEDDRASSLAIGGVAIEIDELNVVHRIWFLPLLKNQEIPSHCGIEENPGVARIDEEVLSKHPRMAATIPEILYQQFFPLAEEIASPSTRE